MDVAAVIVIVTVVLAVPQQPSAWGLDILQGVECVLAGQDFATACRHLCQHGVLAQVCWHRRAGAGVLAQACWQLLLGFAAGLIVVVVVVVVVAAMVDFNWCKTLLLSGTVTQHQLFWLFLLLLFLSLLQQ